jgi:hypothetical protein
MTLSIRETSSRFVPGGQPVVAQTAVDRSSRWVCPALRRCPPMIFRTASDVREEN